MKKRNLVLLKNKSSYSSSIFNLKYLFLLKKRELEKKSSNLDTEKEKNIRVFRDLERETKKKREDLERLETDHLSIEEELKNLEQRTEERKKRALKMQKDVDNLKNELRSYPTPEELDIKGVKNN